MIVILEHKRRRLGSNPRDVRGKMPLLELGNRLLMDGLCLRRSVLLNQFFALGQDLAERAGVYCRIGFFKRTPFHNRA